MRTNQVMNMDYKPGLQESPSIQPKHKPILNKRTVMIVSASEDRIKTVSRQLYFEGFYCLKEYQCAQAMETLFLLNVGIILIDLDIPVGEAESFIAWLEVHRPEIHVFFVSGTGYCYELQTPEKTSCTAISYTANRLAQILKMIREERPTAEEQTDTER